MCRSSGICLTGFKDPRQPMRAMFAVRLVEHPLPSVERDVDALVEWMISTLALVRKRGEATADDGRAGPVHRLLRDHLLGQPNRAWDAQMLADDLALMPASLNHHLSRLVESGLIGFTNEGKGWRKYYLNGGSVSHAVAFLQQRAQLVLKQRTYGLERCWHRKGLDLPVELGQSDAPSLMLGVVDHRPTPVPTEGDWLSHWMNDFGLLGERPGKELHAQSLSVRLFEDLLGRDAPLSLDEATELHGGDKARIGRILERFRATSMVERVPRTDRLTTALWTAMTSQYQRRGPDWMLKKGGFQRLLNDELQTLLLRRLEAQELTIEHLNSLLNDVDVREQMLLLNLLGGRLPMGYRMAGNNVETLHRAVETRMDRVLRRMARVAGLLDEALPAYKEDS